jgi:hypothetical protein
MPVALEQIAQGCRDRKLRSDVSDGAVSARAAQIEPTCEQPFGQRRALPAIR